MTEKRKTESPTPSDATPATHMRSPKLWKALLLLFAAVDLWLVGKLAIACATKAYAIDEFYYTHKAWVVGQSGEGVMAAITGGTRFAFTLFLVPFTRLGGDDPSNMIFVRLAMLPLFLGIVALMANIAAKRLATKRTLGVYLVTIFLALSTTRLVWHGIEIRPDCLAIFLVLGCVSLLEAERIGNRMAAFCAGFVLFIACFTSVKVIVYGAVMAPAFLVDEFSRFKRRPQILRCARSFALGFWSAALILLLLVVAFGSIDTFWEGFYERARSHQQHYPTIPAGRYLWPFVTDNMIVVVLAGFGVVALTVQAVQRWRRDHVVSRDWLVVALMASVIISFTTQKGPWAYSLIPVGAVGALCAAVGVVSAGRLLLRLGKWRLSLAVVPGLCAGLLVVDMSQSTDEFLTPEITNQRQIALHSEIAELTSLDDVVYDMSATFVYRPRANRHPFIDEARRRRFGEHLPDEVIHDLVENEAVMFVYELRFNNHWRQTRLGRFIAENYQRYNDDLFFWGRRWRGTEPVETEFWAIKDGSYFVHPADALDAVEIRLDGRRLSAPIFELSQGSHSLELGFSAGSKTPVFLIWLPRNGEPFDPMQPSPPFALGRHVLP